MAKGYSSEAFRRSVFRYSFGRIANAAAAFLIFLWVARSLPESEYASYVAAFAVLEIGLALSSFGMEWVTAVYVPRAKLKASGRTLVTFIFHCASIQGVALLLSSWFLLLAAPRLSTWFGLEAASTVLQVYALVMFVEGLSRVFRDQLLSCLLLHGAAQASQFVRNILLFVLLLWLFQSDQWRTAETLALAEMAASGASLLLAAGLLVRYLIQVRADSAADPAWSLPPWRELFKAASHAWISTLANISWGGQMVILLVTRIIGSEATAPLGFARNLSSQIRKYMPMEFLLGIVRTLLVARFAQEGDRHKLGTRAHLMYKANLLFLLPLLVVAIVRGDEVCELLSGGRYASAHWLLVGWLSVLVVLAHHRVAEVLAHTLGKAYLTSQASLVLTITVLALFVAAKLQWWSLLFAVLISAEGAFSAIVLSRLRTPHWSYRPDWLGLSKFGIASLLAGIGISAIRVDNQAVSVSIATGAAFGIMWVAVWLLNAWSRDEQSVLPTRMIRRTPVRSSR